MECRESRSMFQIDYCEWMVHCGKNAYFHKHGSLRPSSRTKLKHLGPFFALLPMKRTRRCVDSPVRMERGSGSISDHGFEVTPQFRGMSGFSQREKWKFFWVWLCLFSHYICRKDAFLKTREIISFMLSILHVVETKWNMDFITYWHFANKFEMPQLLYRLL